MQNNPLALTNLKYTRDFSIATAPNRNSAHWHNSQMSLCEFVHKLSSTTRTAETHDEYQASPKSRRDDIKDVGGFVAGMLKGGRRKKEAVANRSAITLDADFADVGFLERVKKLLFDTNYLIYSTHSHTPHKPRYRLIIVTDRAMHVDEYGAASRKLAETLGIDAFDDTTYETNRLMYWPSTSKDAEYVCVHNDKPFFSVDNLLAEYGNDEDWRDVASWPKSSRETRNLANRLKKLGDPREKKNIVGATCRIISIYTALEMLSDVYEKEKTDRYTYRHGSTSGGLVVYDGLWAFSNHDSDPTQGMSCNAFDLLRIHNHGHLDADSQPDTPTHRLPSYNAMAEWARAHPDIRTALVEQKIENDILEEFEDLESKKNWLKKLDVCENGVIKPSFTNAIAIVGNDNKTKDMMAFNRFSMRVERDGQLDLWRAIDSYEVRKHIGEKYRVDFPETKIEQAIEYRAQLREFHPVIEYLERLEWDGKERVDGLLVDYFNCEDNPYTREVMRCWLVAAVTRVYEPGYKFDYVPVLGGAQGIGKSTFVRELAKRRWYNDLSTFEPKMAVEETNGRWLVEINEMGATNRHDLEQQKAFLSGQSTTVRMAYARHPVEFHRQCVFIGTTNRIEYLKDSTGNRRWWPIECQLRYGETIDFQRLRSEVDQIWAEAACLHMLGTSTILSVDAQAIATQVQEEKREQDEWEGRILEWLDAPASPGRYDEDAIFDEPSEPRDRVCIAEIWEDCLEQKPNTIRRTDSNRICAIMDNQTGWIRKTTVRFGSRFGRQRGWERVPF